MEIIGAGFLARGLGPLTARHPGAVLFAKGVSSTGAVPEQAYQREAEALGEQLARTARDGRLLVFPSTASHAMYGVPEHPAAEDDEVAPDSPYGRHKLRLETMVRDSGVRHLIVRLSHVVGPGQPPHQLIPVLVDAVRSGHVQIRRGSYRDLIGVSAVAAVVDALLTAGVEGQVVNVASGWPAPVELIIDHLQERIGVPVERSFLTAKERCPVSLAKLRRLVPAVDRLGFGPAYYRRALDEFFDDHLDRHLDDHPVEHPDETTGSAIR